MKYGDNDFDEDLFFEHTKMSFWDHIEELRLHMWKAIAGFLVGMIVGFFVGKFVLVTVIARPVEKALVRFHEKRMAKRIAEKKSEQGNEEHRLQDFQFMLPPDDAAKLFEEWGVKTTKRPTEALPIRLQVKTQDVVEKMAPEMQELIRPPTLSTLSATEAFIVWIKVCMYVGLVISSPWVFYQMWSFIAAGLYPHEKRLVHLYMPVSILLFLGGVLFSEFVILPVTLDYLLDFNEWMNLEPDLRLNEWLTFAIMFPLIFGLCFQLPLVMFVLHRVGIVDVEVYKKHRRLAYFLIGCLNIIVGMSPDPMSVFGMVISMILLYELGILFCRFSPRPLLDFGEPEEEEMVEA
jgi:sec-independent protein translocase protein TatC